MLYSGMAYSEDIRRSVVKCVRQGKTSITEASKLFGVNRGSIYTWLARGDALQAKKPGPTKAHKINMKELSKMMEKGCDKMLKEIAKEFGVSESAISKALKKLGITRKKNDSLRRGKGL
jgi:transposase